MRKAFERQLRLDCPSVTNVPLNLHCRHETVPILHALQHVYSRPAVRDSILRAIARDVNGKSNARRGRPGLSYWEILVLAVVNSRKGLQFAIERNSPLRALEADARAGLSPEALAVRYCEGYVFHASDAVYAQRLETLRKCRLGPYRGLSDDPLPSPLRGRPIVPIDPERPPADTVPLSAGAEFTQRFSVAGPVEIRRIDLCLGQWRRNRSPDHVDWILAEIAPAGGDGYLAGGRIDLRSVADHGFVSLDFPAVAVEGAKQFAIRLAPLPEEESQPPLNLPVFAATAGSAASDARNLNGFLFYEIIRDKGI